MANTSLAQTTDVRAALGVIWGAEWLALSPADRTLIVRDCTEEGGVDDLAQYRRDIFPGNLQSYALTQRVRFAPKAVR